MSVAEPTAQLAPVPRVARRPMRKRAMHLVRRGHLYFGLFLLPWVILYGATGFLFNHPTAFSDAPFVSFGASETNGTPMESLPAPSAIAEQVVQALNERAKEGKPYTLVEPEKAKYTRDFAFATVKVDDREVSVLFDVVNSGGTVRSRPAPAVTKVEEKAPFAVTGTKGGAPKGGAPKGGGRGERGAPKGAEKTDAPTLAGATTGPLVLPEPMHERVKAAVPVVLERTGFQGGEVKVSSVPDLSFLMSDGTKTWRVTYNAMDGTVGGASTDSATPPDELSTRRFLTRLHLTHGFPGGQNAKWFWAVIVDAMAFVMVFWGVSGIFMWWQLKATRRIGGVVLLFSVVVAAVLGLGMHDLLSPR